MPSRLLTRLRPQSLPLFPRLSPSSARTFRTSRPRRLADVPASALPARKPVGAFRGGLIGFLLGTSLGAYGSYFYLFEQYTRSNDLLNEDMYALQAAVTRLHNYCLSLEDKIDALDKRRR